MLTDNNMPIIPMDDYLNDESKEPRLVDTSIAVEHIKNKEDQLKTTETDMMFEYFANEDKMISEDNREFYDPDDRETSNKKDDNELNNYIKDNDTQKDFPNPYSSFGQTNQINNDYSYDNQSYNRSDNRSDKNEQNDIYLQESQEDTMLKKLEMLRKLGELKEHGAKISQNYNMNSDLKAMTYEYDLHRSIRAKKNGVQWMSTMLVAAAQGLEMMNEQYDPFSLKIKGFGEIMNAKEADFYDTLGELYEKYQKPGKSMPPELKLVGMLGMVIGKVHFANSKADNEPSMDQHLRNNPQLAEQLRHQAAVDRLKQEALRNRNAMNNIINKEHTAAANKASNIDMLNKKKMEFMIAQNNMNQINSVRDQLQQIDVHSNSTVHSQRPIIMPRKIPPGMVIPSFRPSNDNEQETLRQQQIIEQKKRLQQQELMRMQMQMRNRIETQDNDSVVTPITNIGSDEVSDSDKSKVLVKKRSRKNKVATLIANAQL